MLVMCTVQCKLCLLCVQYSANCACCVYSRVQIVLVVCTVECKLCLLCVQYSANCACCVYSRVQIVLVVWIPHDLPCLHKTIQKPFDA